MRSYFCRNAAARGTQNGSLFFALFGAVAMVGVLGAGMNMVMRGPVTTMSEVTRRTVAENNMIASTRLAIVMSPTSQANGGDCDGDGYVEPIPYRDAGAGPKPAGGGYVPSTIGASMSDPWQTQYGYCVWDHGAQTVSNNVAACGGTTARRLNGAPLQTQIAVAVISAGKDRTFQTACNAFVDANVDGTPDTPLLNRPGGSDDIILGYTYAEANNMGNNLWALKSGDTGTAQIGKNIEVSGDANVAGRLRLAGGLVLPGDPGNNSITGACNTANDQALRRNTSTSPPVLEICDFAGGQTTWKPVGGAAAAADNLGNHTATQNLDMASKKIINTAIPTSSADVTNKAYVDAAVASAAGGGGAGFTVNCAEGYGSYTYCIRTEGTTGATECMVSQINSSGYPTSWTSCAQPFGGTSSATGGTDNAGILLGGYFVMTSAQYQGTSLGGLRGADQMCLSELQTHPWRGKGSAGALTQNRVRAFLCQGNTCNNLLPYTRYTFAVTRSSTIGGGTFDTDANMQGPNNSTSWAASSTFNSSDLYWTSRGSASGIAWASTSLGTNSAEYCNNWSAWGSSGYAGYANSSNQQRWNYNQPSCGNTYNLICYVNPEGATPPADPCAVASPAVGTVCHDGSIYAGLSPSNSKKMYTTNESAAQMQFSVYGSRSYGATSLQDGRANTAAIMALAGTPDPAAAYCDGLTSHGKTDWYLPALYEGSQVMGLNTTVRNAIGGWSGTSATHWSSTTASSTQAYHFTPSGGQSISTITNSQYVRCVRRED